MISTKVPSALTSSSSSHAAATNHRTTSSSTAALMRTTKPVSLRARRTLKPLLPTPGFVNPRHVTCRSFMQFVSDQPKDVNEDGVEDATGALLAGQKGTAQIFTAEGTNQKLDLILSFIDKDGYEVAPVDTSKFKPKKWEKGTETLGVVWEGAITVPAGARTEFVVLKIKPDGKDTAEYVNKIEITAGDFSTTLAPNSWIHRSNGGRIFFASQLSLLPQQTPGYLREFRQADLDDIQGTATERALQRQEWDRIYDYDVYNDLAGPKLDRPILGNNERYPYPRRIRSGRPRVTSDNGTIYESREGAPWVPLNEKFNTRKQVNFNTYTVLSILPLVGNALRQLFFNDFKMKDFKEVDAMYAKLADPKTTIKDNELENITKKNDRPWWLLFPTQAARDSSFDAITSMVGGAKNLLKFPPPKVWKGRETEWQKDEEWGRQALAGVNPSVVQAVTSLDQLGSNGLAKAVAAEVEKLGHKLEPIIAQHATDPRLLFINYYPVFEDYAERITNQDKKRYGYSGMAVLFRRDDEQWVPIGIELKGSGGEVEQYTPADKNLWLLAKGVFTSIDSGYHQLITHWLRTHACTEPYIISMRRNLSQLHPVFKLLAPHTAFTSQINANARANLINGDGIVERVFTPGKYAIRMSAEVYKKLWRFNKEGLPYDLENRGLAKRESDGSVKLLLKDYPYADDGMLLWSAMEKWVGGYLKLYYGKGPGSEEEELAKDTELQKFWDEIKNKGHKDVKEGWPELRTINDLTQILCTMIWMASAHHAAINFSQYDFCSYGPSRPTFCFKAIPPKDPNNPDYQALMKDEKSGEKVYLETLFGFTGNMLNNLTVELLSTHADNEAYIGEPNHMFITDKEALKLYKKFTDEVAAMEKTIEARNKDASLKMRSAPGLAYTTLMPTSGPGITNRGIPQSISI